MASYQRILITGGAGFVGSTLALAWKRAAGGVEVIALDNLKRRGSELALMTCQICKFEIMRIRTPDRRPGRSRLQH